MALQTGNGTTVVFTGGGFTARITSIEPGGRSREAIDASGLDTDNDAEMMPGDLWRHDPWTFNFLVDAADDAKTEPPSGVDTLTITAADGATWVGSGFVTGVTPPSFENDQLLSGSFEFQFDGISAELAFTDSAT